MSCGRCEDNCDVLMGSECEDCIASRERGVIETCHRRAGPALNHRPIVTYGTLQPIGHGRRSSCSNILL